MTTETPKSPSPEAARAEQAGNCYFIKRWGDYGHAHLMRIEGEQVIIVTKGSFGPTVQVAFFSKEQIDSSFTPIRPADFLASLHGHIAIFLKLANSPLSLTEARPEAPAASVEAGELDMSPIKQGALSLIKNNVRGQHSNHTILKLCNKIERLREIFSHVGLKPPSDPVADAANECNRCHQKIDGISMSDPHDNDLCPTCYGETEAKGVFIENPKAATSPAPAPVADAAKRLAEAYVARVDILDGNADDEKEMMRTKMEINSATAAYRAAIAAKPAEPEAGKAESLPTPAATPRDWADEAAEGFVKPQGATLIDFIGCCTNYGAMTRQRRDYEVRRLRFSIAALLRSELAARVAPAVAKALNDGYEEALTDLKQFRKSWGNSHVSPASVSALETILAARRAGYEICVAGCDVKAK